MLNTIWHRTTTFYRLHNWCDSSFDDNRQRQSWPDMLLHPTASTTESHGAYIHLVHVHSHAKSTYRKLVV